MSEDCYYHIYVTNFFEKGIEEAVTDVRQIKVGGCVRNFYAAIVNRLLHWSFNFAYYLKY